MKRAIAIVRRAKFLPFGLIAAINALFLLAFAATLLIAAGRVDAAEMPKCTGSDMMAELAATDPAALGKIQEQANATLNGKGLLWKIETSGAEPSYLFGTMHMTDPRVTSLTPDAEQAF